MKHLWARSRNATGMPRATSTGGRRRRPWCTIRRCIKAYRTGRASEFDTLRHYLKEAKDELTEEAQEAATDQATEAFQDLAEKMADWLECLEF